MSPFELVHRSHVRQALEEHDRLGAEEFMSQHGFGPARGYHLRHGGRIYDSKAILGVALEYATGDPAASADFAGGKDSAARVLHSLGFNVSFEGDTTSAESPATGEWREASEVGAEEAKAEWADAARDALIAVAGRYNAVISYKELANDVQIATGVRTKQLNHYWLGDVLSRVAAECAKRDEPLLSSLCINTAGSVGASYGTAVEMITGEAPEDPDVHAAGQRLLCHERFGATMPPDGGAPTLTAKLTASRERSSRAKPMERATETCPTCHMQLPATKVCNYCD